MPCMPGDLLRFLDSRYGGSSIRQRCSYPLRQYRRSTAVPSPCFYGSPLPVGGGRFSAQMTPRCPEQILQQFALPGIPYFRAGAADIRNRKQIKRDKATLIATCPAKSAITSRSDMSFLLCGHRHHQMIFNKPCNQLDILRHIPWCSQKRLASVLCRVSSDLPGVLLRCHGTVRRYRALQAFQTRR